MAIVDPSAFYISKSIEELKAIAEQETAHSQRLQPIADTFNAITAQILQPAIEGLGIGIQKVHAQWRDNTFPTAFEAPATEGMKSLQHSKDVIEAANVPGEIAELQTGVANAKTAFDAIYEAYQRANQPTIVGNDGAWAEMPPDPQVLENIRLQAVAEIVKMDQAFAIAGAQIAMAAQGHVWNGPRAAGAPAPPAPGTSPSSNSPTPQSQPTTQPSGTPPSEQPQQSQEQQAQQQPQQQGGEQQPQQQGGAPPAGQPPTGPTGPGLAGGGPAAPPTLPNTPGPTPGPTPTPTPPPGPGPTPGPTPTPPIPGPATPGGAVPVGGAGAPLAAAAGAGTRGGVEQAARNLSVPKPAGSTASAPSLPTTTTGTPSTQGPVGAGGVPPMMPPMMPQGPGANNGKPRPGTAQPVHPGRTRPAGPTAGVPSGLRGRTGKADGGAKPAPVSRRARRDGPQTVEILDSELWQVDEPSPAAPAERRTTRQSDPPQASGSVSAS